ncbi:MAG: GTPase Era [Pseudomonadota bacterium]
MADHPTKRAGFVAILGPPNAGKSTLLNTLVGAKVSIVSPKVQTTRRRIIGITIHQSSQIIFIDTPGIFAPKRQLDRAMVQAAWSVAGDADLVLIVADASRLRQGDLEAVIRGVVDARTSCYLVLNKTDLVPKPKLLPLIDSLQKKMEFKEILLVSALHKEGCDELLTKVAEDLPEGPWLYPEDELSDLSQRALAAEITREKIFQNLHQELPYNITVETESWVEGASGEEVRIDQTIYVMRDNQKAIVLGHRGQMIKAIGAAARTELEALLDVRVHLFLFVKIRPNWMDDPERYAEMGLDFPGR